MLAPHTKFNYCPLLCHAAWEGISTLMAILAEFERDLVRERVRSGIAAYLRTGAKIRKATWTNSESRPIGSQGIADGGSRQFLSPNCA